MPKRIYKHCGACGVSTEVTETAESLGIVQESDVTTLYTASEVYSAEIDLLQDLLKTIKGKNTSGSILGKSDWDKSMIITLDTIEIEIEERIEELKTKMHKCKNHE